MERELTLKQLNRATLDRQLLLRRGRHSVPKALQRIVGIQAEDPVSPYIGLHARIASFRPSKLDRALESREVVRALLMRGTRSMQLQAKTICLGQRRCVMCLSEALAATFRLTPQRVISNRLCEKQPSWPRKRPSTVPSYAKCSLLSNPRWNRGFLLSPRERICLWCRFRPEGNSGTTVRLVT